MRESAAIATKLLLRVGLGGSVYTELCKHLKISMRRLQADHLDICHLHRMGGVPVAKVAEAMGQLIGGWGLSQVDVNIIGRAQEVVPLAAVRCIPYFTVTLSARIMGSVTSAPMTVV